MTATCSVRLGDWETGRLGAVPHLERQRFELIGTLISILYEIGHSVIANRSKSVLIHNDMLSSRVTVLVQCLFNMYYYIFTSLIGDRSYQVRLGLFK